MTMNEQILKSRMLDLCQLQHNVQLFSAKNPDANLVCGVQLHSCDFRWQAYGPEASRQEVHSPICEFVEEEIHCARVAAGLPGGHLGAKLVQLKSFVDSAAVSGIIAGVQVTMLLDLARKICEAERQQHVRPAGADADVALAKRPRLQQAGTGAALAPPPAGPALFAQAVQQPVVPRSAVGGGAIGRQPTREPELDAEHTLKRRLCAQAPGGRPMVAQPRPVDVTAVYGSPSLGPAVSRQEASSASSPPDHLAPSATAAAARAQATAARAAAASGRGGQQLLVELGSQLALFKQPDVTMSEDNDSAVQDAIQSLVAMVHSKQGKLDSALRPAPAPAANQPPPEAQPAAPMTVARAGAKRPRLSPEQMKALVESVQQHVHSCPERYTQLVIADMQTRFPTLTLNMGQVRKIKFRALGKKKGAAQEEDESEFASPEELKRQECGGGGGCNTDRADAAASSCQPGGGGAQCHAPAPDDAVPRDAMPAASANS